ncbi:hypothetical protein NDU88_000265, partial [Pleurodeles waltl]
TPAPLTLKSFMSSRHSLLPYSHSCSPAPTIPHVLQAFPAALQSLLLLYTHNPSCAPGTRGSPTVTPAPLTSQSCMSSRHSLLPYSHFCTSNLTTPH